MNMAAGLVIINRVHGKAFLLDRVIPVQLFEAVSTRILCLLQANTYQAIVISDGLKTFTVFTYNCDQLNWVGSTDSYAAVGFNVLGSSDDFRNFENHPFSQQSEVRRVACSNSELNRPWANLVYRVGVAINSEQNSRSRCLARVAMDERNFPISRDALSDQNLAVSLKLHDCPCSVFQAQKDFRFILDYEVGFLGDNICLFSRFPAEYDRFFLRYRCCYDSLRLEAGGLMKVSKYSETSIVHIVLEVLGVWFLENFLHNELCM